AVYMSTPGAQETLAGYQRTIDRLETILQGSIHNHAIDEVVAELRGTLVHRGGSGPEGVGRRVGEVTPVIPGGEDVTGAIPPDGGGEGILPPDGGGGAGPETLTPEEIKDNLDEARDEYLEAYNIRKKWFRKRVSPELEERLRERYKQATLRYARQRAEEDVTRDNPETTGAERQALIEARMIIEAQNERKVFSDLEIKRLNEKSEKFTRTQKIRKWMKDHPKTVIFAGLAMGGIPGGILFGVGAYDLANKYFGASKPKQELFFREEIENDPDKINAKVAQLVEGASRDEKTIDNDKERKRLYDKVLRIEREEMERIRTENPNLPNDQIEARIIGQAMNYLETREDIRDIKRKRQIIAAVSATVFGPWIGGAYGVFGYLV
ncbi:MAG: hypothetical protein PHU86_04005, partial [Patescibacteria group bacterium]|nr:hypothetical protein [Patescibacteria group bacterium]